MVICAKLWIHPRSRLSQEIDPSHLVLGAEMWTGMPLPNTRPAILQFSSDLFCVIRHEPLLRLRPEEPASYPPGEIFTLDRPSEVEDICNFIVEYIHSDVLVRLP